MSDFLFDGLTQPEIDDAIIRGRIAAAIYNKRCELNMTQKEFAEYLNVSQGMVSKWESTDYSFTVSSLIELMSKLKISFNISIDGVPAIKKGSRPDGTVKKYRIRKV